MSPGFFLPSSTLFQAFWHLCQSVSLPKPLTRLEVSSRILPIRARTYSISSTDPLDSFGVGHLIPRSRLARDDTSVFGIASFFSAFGHGGWLGEVVIPLYKQPQGTLQGWIFKGRFLKRTAYRRDFTVEDRPFAMLKGGYKGNYPTFIVLELRADGWLRFRHSYPTDTDDGTAWTHESYLDLGKFFLTVETWEKFLLEHPYPFLYFRNGMSTRSLHVAPSASSETLISIPREGRSNTIKFLEFEGDWAKINLTVYERGESV